MKMKKYEITSNEEKTTVTATIEVSYHKDYYEKFMEHAENYLKSYELYDEDLYDNYNYIGAANDFILAHMLLKEHAIYRRKATTKTFAEHLNALSDDASYYNGIQTREILKEKGSYIKKLTEKKIEIAYKEMEQAFNKEVRRTACPSCGEYKFVKKDYSFGTLVNKVKNSLEKHNWDTEEALYQASPECISESLKWIN
jgi:hypothetical protein